MTLGGRGMTMSYDEVGLLCSWLRHAAHLRAVMGKIAAAITDRATTHDLSKLEADEFEGFARINRVAREYEFGSPEYAALMANEQATIDLHFSRNAHHPEHPRIMGDAAEKARGLPDDATYFSAVQGAEMTWLDIVEMVCDWRAAQLGYGDNTRTWMENVDLNLTLKGHHLSEYQEWLARSVAATINVQVVGA